MTQVWIAVITASAALLGVIVTATVNHLVQRANAGSLFALEQLRISATQQGAAAAERMSALGEVHVAVSRVEREFSMSRLVALLDAKTSLAAYDELYVAECERFGRARFLVALHAVNAQQQVEAIYAQMNVFWGGTRGAIIDQAAGTAMATSASFENACKAARDLSASSAAAKRELEELGRSSR